MKASITVIRLLLWTSQQTDTKISVDKKFWLYPERSVKRDELASFIHSCQMLGDGLYELINNCQPFINVRRFLGMTNSVMHQALFQSLAYVKENEVETILINVFESVCYLNRIFNNIDDKKFVSKISCEDLVKYVVKYFSIISDDNLSNIDSRDLTQFIIDTNKANTLQPI